MDRRGFEAALEATVRAHRFTIAITFPLVGAALFLAASAGLVPSWLAFDPLFILFGTVVMRLPLVGGLAPLVDRRAGAALLALTAYTYGVEFLGVTTGFPYGTFSYRLHLGPMLFGVVPLGLPLFFFPLVLNAFLLALLLLGSAAGSRAVRLLVAAGIVVGMDLVLDPGAVSLGFWRYAADGVYYGVPLSNYAGWVLSGLVAVGLVDLGFDWRALERRLETCEFVLDDLLGFLLLWGVVNAYFENWLALLVAAFGFVALVRTDRFDFDVLGRQAEGTPER